MIGNVLTKIAKLGHKIGVIIDKENRRVILNLVEGGDLTLKFWIWDVDLGN